MKTTFIAFAALALAACSQTPMYQKENAPIRGYTGLQAMTQDQVIQQTHNCLDANMRPSIEYMNQQYSNGSVQVPVQVNCYPSWRR